MNTRARNRTVAGLVAAALVGATAFAAAAPASADPGDASAIGAAGSFSVHLGSIFDFDVSNVIGGVAVSNPGNDSSAEFNQKLLDLGISSVTIAATNSLVHSDDDSAWASTLTSGTSVNLFGLSLVHLDSAEAKADCPVAGTPSATVQTQGLTILGIPVTVDDTTPAGVQETQLPAAVDNGDGPVDLSGVHISVQVAQQTIADSAAAAGVALAVQVLIEGSFTDLDSTVVTIPPATVAASLVLALAGCETPAVTPVVPFSATGITPAQGTAAGGQTVTISGTGFGAGTLVTFNGAPATGIVASPDGTSLTAVTPAGSAGAAVVQVQDGASGPTAQLAYTYLAVPPTPTPTHVPVVPASNGSSTLAATGAAPVGTVSAAAGLLGLGALLALGAVALRRRRQSA